MNFPLKHPFTMDFPIFFPMMFTFKHPFAVDFPMFFPCFWSISGGLQVTPLWPFGSSHPSPVVAGLGHVAPPLRWPCPPRGVQLEKFFFSHWFFLFLMFVFCVCLMLFYVFFVLHGCFIVFWFMEILWICLCFFKWIFTDWKPPWVGYFNQWEFQDPKIEVLYHIRAHSLGMSPYIGLI